MQEQCFVPLYILSFVERNPPKSSGTFSISPFAILESKNVLSESPYMKPSNFLYSCPLCTEPNTIVLGEAHRRLYISCSNCQLIFVPPPYHLTPQQEKAHYDQHHNDPEDEAYRKFLQQVMGPLHTRLVPRSSGLDFGAGPGPTLSCMLQEVGHTVSIYDPYYAQDLAVLNQKYDFITATEVAEHLHQPGLVLNQLWAMLHGDGLLALMTQLTPDNQPFFEWYYLRDPTHVCFFSASTWSWLSDRWSAEIAYWEKNVIIFAKPSHTTPA